LAQPRKFGPRPISPARAHLRPSARKHGPAACFTQHACPLPRARPQPGPGPGIRYPAWAKSGPSSVRRRIRSDGRPRVSSEQKPRRGRSRGNPRSIRHSPSLSSPQCRDEERRLRRPPMVAEGRGGGAATGPLAGACARPRVSAPPSSGLVATPFTPEPVELPKNPNFTFSPPSFHSHGRRPKTTVTVAAQGSQRRRVRRRRGPPRRSVRSPVGERTAVERSYDSALACARARGGSFFPCATMSTAVE